MRLCSALLGTVLATACGVAQAQVPLPKDLSIVAPGAGVPAADAAFSGAWGNGAWYGTLPTALIVERIAADGTAQVIYARGTTEHSKIAAYWKRLEGRIKDHRLTIHLPDPNSSAGYRVQYRIVAPGLLEGDVTNWDGWRGHAFLQRISGPPAAIVAIAALPFRPIWRQIWIPEHWAGQTIQLEATLYRTRLPGRQPLVILNHGADIHHESYTVHFPAQSRFFLARGYNVVVPMRKGFSRSGGPLGTGVDGAVADVDAVVDAMRAEPWVDPKRIIVAGWSRGGLTSVAYAARHPDKVAGVISFSGTWSSHEEADRPYIAAAGKTAPVPELWLYDENDSYIALPAARKLFDVFRANGGTGDFVTFGNVSGMPPGATGEGHTLFEHVDMWKAAVAAYLRRIDGG
ncbi:MAG TPA: alpha/beta fold hydrolase [Stellaceae bacterium]|nr:alpha/beta fold hydrolase [Stellaceae bacterium]